MRYGRADTVTRRGFWIAQLSWWGSYFVLFHLASLPGLADTSFHGQLILVGQKAAKAGVGFAASLVLYAIYVRYTTRWRAPVLGAVAFAVSFALGVAWELGMRAFYMQRMVDGALLRASLQPTFVLVAWSALYFTFLYRERANTEAARALRGADAQRGVAKGCPPV